MPTVTVYDRKGNQVILEAVGRGMFAKLGEDGNPTGSVINLKTALQCEAYFTEEQHEKFLAKQEKRERANAAAHKA